MYSCNLLESHSIFIKFSEAYFKETEKNSKVYIGTTKDYE
jgi:hypothetical protein